MKHSKWAESPRLLDKVDRHLYKTSLHALICHPLFLGKLWYSHTLSVACNSLSSALEDFLNMKVYNPGFFRPNRIAF
jgi:hypothetical protein